MSLNIDLLCRAAAQENATDLFLREGQVPQVRLKGTIMELGEGIVSAGEIANFWKNCGADPAVVRDRDVSYTAADGSRYRVNLHRCLGRPGAVLRPVKTIIPDMPSLGLPEELFCRWLTRSAGLIFVAGATGMGKSTTVAAALQWMNRHLARHVVTIEDPIEYLLADENCFFTQREVGTDTDSFEQGLKSALRQSPDAIFLGEILALSSARAAVQAAETGHLVITTLHSADVGDTLERIVDFFPSDERDSVRHVLSQRTIGLFCQKLLPGTDGEPVLVTEYVQNEGAVPNWIRKWETEKIHDFIARGGSPAARCFLDSIVEAARAGRISMETGERFCGSGIEFQRAMRGISGRSG